MSHKSCKSLCVQNKGWTSRLLYVEHIHRPKHLTLHGIDLAPLDLRFVCIYETFDCISAIFYYKYRDYLSMRCDMMEWRRCEYLLWPFTHPLLNPFGLLYEKQQACNPFHKNVKLHDKLCPNKRKIYTYAIFASKHKWNYVLSYF